MATIRERKTKKGSTWYAEIRLKGHAPMFASFTRKTDARNWVQKTEAAIKDGRDFGSSAARKRTLSDMIQRYLRDLLPLRKSDARDVERHLKWWEKQLGTYQLNEIKPSHIAELRDKLLSEKTNKEELRNPATVVRYLASLSLCYSYAVKEWCWVEENPVKKVRKPTESRGRLRFLSDMERESLIKNCKASNHPYLYIVVVVALSTGARQGEILKLRWKDVDLYRRVLLFEETKNGERRSVPLSKNAHRILSDLSKIRRIDTDYVFPNSDGLKPCRVREAWDKAVKSAKLNDFRFHDLRHTAASYLAMNGATLAEMSAILGHKTLAMVKRYAHLTEQHTAEVLERMNDKMFQMN